MKILLFQKLPNQEWLHYKFPKFLWGCWKEHQSCWRATFNNQRKGAFPPAQNALNPVYITVGLQLSMSGPNLVLVELGLGKSGAGTEPRLSEGQMPSTNARLGWLRSCPLHANHERGSCQAKVFFPSAPEEVLHKPIKPHSSHSSCLGGAHVAGKRSPLP